MDDKEFIPPGKRIELDHIDNNVEVGDGATLVAKDEEIYIAGTITSKGSFSVVGNLTAISIRCKRGSLTVEGDLSVKKHIRIDKRLSVEGALLSPEIAVGGVLEVEGDLQSDEIKVGGTLKVEGNVGKPLEIRLLITATTESELFTVKSLFDCKSK